MSRCLALPTAVSTFTELTCLRLYFSDWDDADGAPLLPSWLSQLTSEPRSRRPCASCQGRVHSHVADLETLDVSQIMALDRLPTDAINALPRLKALVRSAWQIALPQLQCACAQCCDTWQDLSGTSLLRSSLPAPSSLVSPSWFVAMLPAAAGCQQLQQPALFCDVQHFVPGFDVPDFYGELQLGALAEATTLRELSVCGNEQGNVNACLDSIAGGTACRLSRATTCNCTYSLVA